MERKDEVRVQQDERYAHLVLMAKTNAQSNYKDSGSDNGYNLATINLKTILSPQAILDVLFVDGLKHNLISISQLCDKGMSTFITYSVIQQQ